MPRFRVRVRKDRRLLAPRNDSLGRKGTPKHFFLSLVDNIPSGLYSPPSCPTERGDRDRHVRGVGCGGRRRCGVTRFGGDVCLRAGRICASTATGKETADLRMERPPGQCDGRPTRNAFGQVLCGYPVPPPWDINFGDGTVRHGRCASNRKNTAGGTSGTCSAPPKVLMHSQLRKTAFASGPRVQRAPGVPHALSTRGWECKGRRRPRAANNGGDDACLKSSGCLTVESA
jgi:hypothetical protein